MRCRGDQGLARPGRGGDHGVGAGEDVDDRLVLVRVQRDPVLRCRGDEGLVQGIRVGSAGGGDQFGESHGSPIVPPAAGLVPPGSGTPVSGEQQWSWRTRPAPPTFGSSHPSRLRSINDSSSPLPFVAPALRARPCRTGRRACRAGGRSRARLRCRPGRHRALHPVGRDVGGGPDAVRRTRRTVVVEAGECRAAGGQPAAAPDLRPVRGWAAGPGRRPGSEHERLLLHVHVGGEGFRRRVRRAGLEVAADQRHHGREGEDARQGPAHRPRPAQRLPPALPLSRDALHRHRRCREGHQPAEPEVARREGVAGTQRREHPEVEPVLLEGWQRPLRVDLRAPQRAGTCPASGERGDVDG